MNKLLGIAFASLIAVTCFTGCGNNKNSESESSSEAESSVTDNVEETSEEETEDSSSESEETSESEDVTESSSENADTTVSTDETTEELPQIETSTMPAYNPDESKEEDFVGKWECKKINSDGVVTEGDIYGIPLNIFVQVEIKDDKTGTLSTGIEGSEDAVLAFTWAYDENSLTAEANDESVDESTSMSFYFQDGEFIMTFSDGTGMTYYYFDKTDEFEFFTEDDLMRAMGVDPATIETQDTSEEESVNDIQTGSAED